MKLMMVLVTVLAACGGGTKRETTGNTAAGGAAGAARVACPDQAKVQELADKAWAGAKGDFGEPECGTFVRGGEAHWIISGYTTGASDGEGEAKVLQRVALVTTAGEVKWHADQEYESFEVEHYLEDDFYGADLDGDGEDEVLSHGTSDSHGEVNTSLSVSKIVGDALVRVEGDMILLSEDTSANAEDPATAVTCEGTMTLVPSGAGQKIHVEYAGTGCAAKASTYELRDGKLVAAS
jgi:hypothetical protein